MFTFTKDIELQSRTWWDVHRNSRDEHESINDQKRGCLSFQSSGRKDYLVYNLNNIDAELCKISRLIIYIFCYNISNYLNHCWVGIVQTGRSSKRSIVFHVNKVTVCLITSAFCFSTVFNLTCVMCFFR